VADASALEDLGVVIVWAVAFAIASLAYYLAQAIAAPLNISIPLVGRPFQFIANAIENNIIGPLDDLRQKSDAQIARGLSGLVDDVATVLGLFLVLGLVVQAALSYLWHHALSPFIHSITDAIQAAAHEALAKVETLTGTVAADLVRAEHYADSEIAAAAVALESYADAAARAAYSEAAGYADRAVATLRAAEDTAIANAVELADAAKAAGLAAAAAVETKLAAEITSGVSEAERYAATTVAAAAAAEASALAQAESAASTALEQVKAIAIGAEGDLTDFEAYIRSLGLPAVIAAVGALATAVTIALTESGLDGSACRAKVKGICGTDPAAWAALLAGVAAVGVSFDLADILELVVQAMGEIDSLVGDLGKISDDVIDQAARGIADLTLQLAA